MSIPIQTVVRYDGQLGVVCPDFMNCCEPGEIPVVYDGASGFMGTDEALLEVVGPENAIADPKKCGAGREADCCIFLVVGPKGFECERFGSLRFTLIFKKDTMHAKREPTALFPRCYLE